MKTIASSCWPLLLVYAVFLGVPTSTVGVASGSVDRWRGIGSTPMHKVHLTQRGYIQFLRWELPVPEIREFTFCLWVNSNNLTHPHSIFSYSKNEKDRLVRSWISSGGRSVHLEIDGVSIFDRSTRIVENRWYHVCQSWEGGSGRYALWIDDRIEVQGQSERMRDHVIRSGGDIVLGQEYTDFDKGLEEGVEGSVLGFNLLLASAFGPIDAIPAGRGASIPPTRIESTFPTRHRGASRFRRARIRRGNVVATKDLVRRESRSYGYVDEEIFRKMPATQRIFPAGRGREKGERIATSSLPEIDRLRDDPLGLQLVKLSYVRCEIGRGSPRVGGEKMLVSWTRTPVRVFGGALLKNVRPECGKFPVV